MGDGQHLVVMRRVIQTEETVEDILDRRVEYAVSHLVEMTVVGRTQRLAAVLRACGGSAAGNKHAVNPVLPEDLQNLLTVGDVMNYLKGKGVEA